MSKLTGLLFKCSMAHTFLSYSKFGLSTIAFNYTYCACGVIGKHVIGSNKFMQQNVSTYFQFATDRLCKLLLP